MFVKTERNYYMDDFLIKETDDFFALSTLFHNSGMGVKIEERRPDRIIKMWRLDDKKTGQLMAAVTFETRDGVYTLGDIAVREDLHHMGYGKVLLNLIFEEAKKLKIKELWACAKEPAFYLHNGWNKVSWEKAPKIAIYCDECPHRGNKCNPEIMKFTF